MRAKKLSIAGLIVLIVTRYVVEPITLVSGISIDQWLGFAIVIAALIAIGVSVRGQTTAPASSRHSLTRYDLLLLCCLLVVGSVQGFTRLNGTGFQNDEWYHVEAAEGYRQTGQFVWWDFLHEQPRTDQSGNWQPYTRAAHYTWLVAQSVNLFGWSETAARTPSVLMYEVFILVMYGFSRWWSRSTRTATLITLTILLFDHIVLHGRLVRMYSMLLAFGTATFWAWIAAYMESMNDRVNKKKLVILIGSGVLLLGMTVLTHSVFLLFPVLFGAFVCSDVVWNRLRNKHWHPITLYWPLVLVVVGMAGAVGALALHQYELFSLIGWRAVPNTMYVLYPFVDFPFVPLAIIIYLIACWKALRGTDTVSRFLAMESLLSILVFIFAIQRYGALRYSIVFTPLIVMLVVRTWDDTIQQVISSIQKKFIRYVLGLLIVVITIVPLSWPGIAKNTFMNTARADMTHHNGFGADIQTAYQYIQEHRASDEAVFVVLFRSYYWADATASIVNMGVEQSLTVSQLQALMSVHQRGWIVWSDRKRQHLKSSVKEYIQRHADHVSVKAPELQKSNMQVYYFDVTSTGRKK